MKDIIFVRQGVSKKPATQWKMYSSKNNKVTLSIQGKININILYQH